MGTLVGVGFSINKNSTDAGKEAVLKALEQGQMHRADFVLVFATVGYRQEVLIRSIREVTSGAPLSGCSAEGIITRGMVAETNFCVAVMTIASDEIRFDHLLFDELSQNPAQAGDSMARGVEELCSKDSLACFLFADGLSFDFAPLLAAFSDSLGKKMRLPVFGGLASDDWASRQTYQYHDDRVVSGGISLVLLSGTGHVAWGVNHGCVPVGTKRTITRCKANVIYEIDGLPALEALRDYFEEDLKNQWNKMSLNLCLGFKTPKHLRKDYNEYVIRYMMAKNDTEGSVTIQSDVEPGTELWIVRRDKELIRTGLHDICEQIRRSTGGGAPKFVLHFECVGRGKVVFRDQEKLDLAKQLQEQIDSGVPWIGFYTYGEIAPIGESNYFHNFTAVVVVFS